jgi:hypothetical protein
MYVSHMRPPRHAPGEPQFQAQVAHYHFTEIYNTLDSESIAMRTMILLMHNS